MTISGVEPLTAPSVAVMVEVPLANVVASPVELMVAAMRSLDDQADELVTSCVVPSENVPSAVNCCVVPGASIGLAGVTVMETSAAVTVSKLEAVSPAEIAVMVEVPVATVVARPCDPGPLLMVAMVVAEELQDHGAG